MPIFALNGGYCNCLFNSICSPTSSRSEEIRATCHAKVFSQIKPPTMKVSHLMTTVFQKCGFFLYSLSMFLPCIVLYLLDCTGMIQTASTADTSQIKTCANSFREKKITCFSRVRNFWCVPVKPKPSSGALRDGFRAREKYA